MFRLMAGPVALRDALVAFGVATASAAGLVTLTPWPWTITLPTSLLLAALVFIVDIVLFGRLASVGTPSGRGMLAVVGTIAGISALVLAFSIGRNTYTVPAPQRYPYIVTSAGGVTTFLKAAPFEPARKDSVVVPGDTVSVDCYVTERDRRWYRLSDNAGWLRGDELLPAPYTGMGLPPRCPS